MNDRKRKRGLGDDAIEQLLYDSDDTYSDISIDSSDEDEMDYESDIVSESDEDNVDIVSSDWMNSGSERNPFNFTGDSGVKFTVEDKNNPMQKVKCKIRCPLLLFYHFLGG